MPKSKWQAEHKGCQAAVDTVKADLTKEIERLEQKAKNMTVVAAECREQCHELEDKLAIATAALEAIVENEDRGRTHPRGGTVAHDALTQLSVVK